MSLLVGALSGCVVDKTAIDKSVDNTPDTPYDGISAILVTRSFSVSEVSPGDSVTIALTKVLNADQKTLLVEETFPAGWTIVDAGDGTVNDNVIKFVELMNAKSGAYTYTLKANSDSGVWSGQYSINGQPPKDIGGSSKLG